MNNITLEKQQNLEVNNHQLLRQGIEEADLEKESLKAVVSVHALFTFTDPGKAMSKMYDWLKPGGYAILVDAGRVINISDWQLALSWNMVWKYGLKKTLEVFRQGKIVSKQNSYIRNMQQKGVFWTHSHKEFCQAVESAGFGIMENQITFRGCSDFVVARKPM